MTIDELVMKIREHFEKALQQKTGWGKNEVITQFDIAVAKASLEALSHHQKEE